MSPGLSPQGAPLRPGHSFLRDGAALGLLRELMVVIRIWGLLKPSCLPVYTATSDTQDSMSLLFRLLTKLWICCEPPPPPVPPRPAPGPGRGPQSLPSTQHPVPSAQRPAQAQAPAACLASPGWVLPSSHPGLSLQ